MKEHELAAKRAPDWLIERVIEDLGKRNLRNLRDHETRWCAERSKAFRAERRHRKSKKTYKPIMPGAFVFVEQRRAA